MGDLVEQEQEKELQVVRALSIYERLRQGHVVVKAEEAVRYGVNERTIQRDVAKIRTYLELEKHGDEIKTSRAKGGYVLSSERQEWLLNEDIFALLKVMIESRAFPKVKMQHLVDQVANLAAPKERAMIQDLMRNETFLYAELQHKKELTALLWQFAQLIKQKQFATLYYLREGAQTVNKWLVKPVGIMFSEYYFYLIAYHGDGRFDFPTVYRMDRIEKVKASSAKFELPYRERFQEGEFRKRVQFMYTGELLNIQFRFTGQSLQAVLDRLPTARIVREFIEGEGTIIEAEVFGKGIQMWLLSQGAAVEVLKPIAFREELKKQIKEMYEQYRE